MSGYGCKFLLFFPGYRTGLEFDQLVVKAV